MELNWTDKDGTVRRYNELSYSDDEIWSGYMHYETEVLNGSNDPTLNSEDPDSPVMVAIRKKMLEDFNRLYGFLEGKGALDMPFYDGNAMRKYIAWAITKL